MKYYISLLLTIFAFSELNAQALEVKVVDLKGEALPYASIYINKNQSYVTNSDGFAYISPDKINYGDTISSTYIGMKTSSIVFNKQIQRLSKCTITLDNNFAYELDPVVVKAIADDDWKFFHKNVKTHNSFIYTNCIVKGKFRAKVQLPQESFPHNIEGSFELKNILPRKVTLEDFFKYYFTALPEITTLMQDTVGVNKARSAISKSISVACQTISRIHGEHIANSKYSKVTYLGQNDNCDFFRIVYTDGNKNSLSYQVLFSVNKDSHEIETVEFDVPQKIQSSSKNPEPFLSAVCRNGKFQKRTRQIILTVPTEIEFNNGMYKDNSKINLTLSDITFQVVN